MVTLAFGQKVCGFDLLRSERARSFVCDVNGWSFVKNSHKVSTARPVTDTVIMRIGGNLHTTVPQEAPCAAAHANASIQQPAAIARSRHHILAIDALCSVPSTVLRRCGRHPAQHHPERHRAAPAVHAARAHARLLHHARPGVRPPCSAAMILHSVGFLTGAAANRAAPRCIL